MGCAECAVCVALIGALLGLDNIAIGQFMLAQPAVGAVLLGYVVGEPWLGVWSGLTFQLLWVGRVPVGAYVPPSAPITAIAAVGMAAPLDAPLASRAVLAAALAIPVGILAGRLDVWVKNRNVAVLHRAENDLLDGRAYALGGAVVKGTSIFFLKDFFLLLVAVFLGSIALSVALDYAGPGWHRGLALAFAVSPAAGIAAAFKMYGRRRNIPAVVAGAGLAGIVAALFATLT